jgi:hypothetical protein
MRLSTKQKSEKRSSLVEKYFFETFWANAKSWLEDWYFCSFLVENFFMEHFWANAKSWLDEWYSALLGDFYIFFNEFTDEFTVTLREVHCVIN